MKRVLYIAISLAFTLTKAQKVTNAYFIATKLQLNTPDKFSINDTTLLLCHQLSSQLDKASPLHSECKAYENLALDSLVKYDLENKKTEAFKKWKEITNSHYTSDKDYDTQNKILTAYNNELAQHNNNLETIKGNLKIATSDAEKNQLTEQQVKLKDSIKSCEENINIYKRKLETTKDAFEANKRIREDSLIRNAKEAKANVLHKFQELKRLTSNSAEGIQNKIANKSVDFKIDGFSAPSIGSQAQAIDALSIYIANRFKEELILEFFNVFTEFLSSNCFARQLFPNTDAFLLKARNIYETPAMGSTWQYYLAEDLITLPTLLSSIDSNILTKNEYSKELKSINQYFMHHQINHNIINGISFLSENAHSTTFGEVEILFNVLNQNLFSIDKKNQKKYWISYTDFNALDVKQQKIFWQVMQIQNPLIFEGRTKDLTQNMDSLNYYTKNILLLLNELDQYKIQGTASSDISSEVNQFYEIHDELISKLFDFLYYLKNNKNNGTKEIFRSYNKLYKSINTNDYSGIVNNCMAIIQKVVDVEKIWKIDCGGKAKENSPIKGRKEAKKKLRDENSKWKLSRSKVKRKTDVDPEKFDDFLTKKITWRIYKIKFPDKTREQYKSETEGWSWFRRKMNKVDWDKTTARTSSTTKIKRRAYNKYLSLSATYPYRYSRKEWKLLRGQWALFDLRISRSVLDRDTLRIKNIKHLNFKVSFGKFQIGKIRFYFSFLSDLLRTKSSNEIHHVIKAYGESHKSYLVKRFSPSSIAVNSYVGLQGSNGWGIRCTSKGLYLSEPIQTFGFTTPLGISFNWAGRITDTTTTDHPNKFISNKQSVFRLKGTSHTIFLSMADIGAVVSYRIVNSDSTALPDGIKDKLTWREIFSPGLIYVYGFKNSPISLLAGARFSPRLVSLYAQSSGRDFKGSLFMLTAGIAWDLPLLNIRKRENITKKLYKVYLK